MAVENKYVDSNLASGKITNPAFTHGAQVFAAVAIAAVAAADDNGSVYRLFKNVDPDLIPLQIIITNSAITAGTDYDLGLYETLTDGQGGTVIDKDCFVDGADLSSAHAEGSGISGLTATATIALTDAQKKIYEIAGHTLTTRKRGYDIALTGNTVGTAAGTVVVKALFIQG